MIEKVTLKEAEGALPKVDDIEYVRCLDKNGDPGYINKQDFATVLGGLVGIDMLEIAFNLKRIALGSESAFVIGAISGLCVVRNGVNISVPFVVLIDNFSRTVTQIAGSDYKLICEFVFEGEGYNTIVSIKNIKTNYTGSFWIAYQSLGFNI